jgi:hypothetical protein
MCCWFLVNMQIGDGYAVSSSATCIHTLIIRNSFTFNHASRMESLQVLLRDGLIWKATMVIVQGLRCAYASGTQIRASELGMGKVFWAWRAYIRGLCLLTRCKKLVDDGKLKVRQQSIALRTQRTALLSCIAAQSECNRRKVLLLRILSWCALIRDGSLNLLECYIRTR